ncbi:hypothetical protein D3C78_1397660 [compost metagenome]
MGDAGLVDVVVPLFTDFAEGLDTDGQLLAGHGRQPVGRCGDCSPWGGQAQPVQKRCAYQENPCPMLRLSCHDRQLRPPPKPPETAPAGQLSRLPNTHHSDRQLFSGFSSGFSTWPMFLVGKLIVLPLALSCRRLALRSDSQNSSRKMSPQARLPV